MENKTKSFQDLYMDLSKESEQYREITSGIDDKIIKIEKLLEDNKIDGIFEYCLQDKKVRLTYYLKALIPENCKDLEVVKTEQFWYLEYGKVKDIFVLQEDLSDEDWNSSGLVLRIDSDVTFKGEEDSSTCLQEVNFLLRNTNIPMRLEVEKYFNEYVEYLIKEIKSDKLEIEKKAKELK